MSLTNIQCQNAKPKDKGYRMPDSGGLFLWVAPTGKKIWRFRYRFPKGGKEKQIVFGEYPLLSIADAREHLSDAKKLLLQDIDPMSIKKEQQAGLHTEQENTFEKIARAWFEYSKDNWTERNAGYVIRRLEQNLFKHIGRVPIANLKRKQILSAIRHTEDRGCYDLAHRLAQYCKQICSYAVNEEIINTSPAVDLTNALKKYKKKHHAALEANEIPEFLRTVEYNKARLHLPTRYALKLIMLTFVRTSELIETEWKEIDFDSAQLIIPGARMKMDQPHIVPLAQQTLEILKELQEINGHSEFVFPNRNDPRRTMSNSTILRAIYQLGYKGKVTGHGFRATAMSTIQEKLGYPYEVADRQLAHAPKTKVQAAYDRAKFLEQRTKMMQDWADYLDEAGAQGQVIHAKFGS